MFLVVSKKDVTTRDNSCERISLISTWRPLAWRPTELNNIRVTYFNVCNVGILSTLLGWQLSCGWFRWSHRQMTEFTHLILSFIHSTLEIGRQISCCPVMMLRILFRILAWFEKIDTPFHLFFQMASRSFPCTSVLAFSFFLAFQRNSHWY